MKRLIYLSRCRPTLKDETLYDLLAQARQSNRDNGLTGLFIHQDSLCLQVIEGENEVGRAARGDEYALGLRYQYPLNEAWIFRSDAMHGWRMEDENLAGLRFEIRRKF